MPHSRPPLPANPRRARAEWLLIVVLAMALCAALSRPGGLPRINDGVYDSFARLTAPPVDPRIVLVTIDDASLAALGRWPWSRATHTALIERLAQAKPKAIVFDILFSERESPAIDARFGDAISRAGDVFLPRATPPDGSGAIGLFGGRAAGEGEVTVAADPDGVLRRLSHCPPGPKAGLMDVVASHVGAARASSTACHDALISFAAGPGLYPTASYVSVLRGEVPPDVFKNRIVLIGAAATGMSDRFQTPIDRGLGMPGVELQAQNLDSLLNNRHRREAGFFPALIWSWAILTVLLVGLRVLSPLWAGALCLGLVAVGVGVSAGLLTLADVWLSPVASIAGVLIVFAIWNWRRLAGASAYLGGLLTKLRQSLNDSAKAPAAPRKAAGGDPVTRQVMDLGAAIEEIDNLRRFSDAILAALPDPTLVVDAQGVVLKANPAAQRGLGRTEPLEGARAVDIIEGLGPRHPGAARDWSTDAKPLQLELSDGRTLLIQTAPCGDAADGSSQTVVRLADVTAPLATARQREQALQLLTHDMRSPMTSILALLDQPGAKGGKTDVDARVAANARRALALADGFVRFAHAEAAPSNRAALDLCDVVSEAVDQLWPQAEAKGLTLVQEGCEAPCLIEGDAALLMRALCNLLDNAVKFAPEGSAVTVDLRVSPPGHPDRRLITIRDAGPGLSVAQAATAFEPFQRFSTKAAGAGLGLAFVRSVVLRHGGAVWCDSRPGEGAAFTMALPSRD